ncbi:MAG: hypothetical protein AAB562_04240 [Patescibacteria group bacterium]
MGAKKKGQKKKGTTGAKRKPSELRLTVTYVPTQGDVQEKPVVMAGAEATVKDVLAQAGVSSERRDVSVNGKAVTDLSTPISMGARITVTERPQGS